MPRNKKPQPEPEGLTSAATHESFGYILVVVITATLLVVLLEMMLPTPVIGAVFSVVGITLVALLALAF
jgi:Flp pilus assembly protein TadB